MTNEMQRLAKRLDEEGAVCSPEETLHQWLKAVHNLFKELETWVAPLIENRVASYTGKVEQNTGEFKIGRVRFERPTFMIQFKVRKFVFRPSSIGKIDLTIQGHEQPPIFQVLLTTNAGWQLVEKGGDVQIPFNEESLAKFLARWV